MTDRPDFGFAGKIAALKPSAAPEPAQDVRLRQVDQVAERAGFASREPVARRKKRQSFEGEAMDQINIRAPVADINAFVEWCEENRFTSGQGFRELVRRIGS